MAASGQHELLKTKSDLAFQSASQGLSAGAMNQRIPHARRKTDPIAESVRRSPALRDAGESEVFSQ
jgi:hypothetical protein